MNFIEVSPAAWPPSCGVQLEMQRPDGSHLYLASQDVGVPLAELVRTFLEAK